VPGQGEPELAQNLPEVTPEAAGRGQGRVYSRHAGAEQDKDHGCLQGSRSPSVDAGSPSWESPTSSTTRDESRSCRHLNSERLKHALCEGSGSAVGDRGQPASQQCPPSCVSDWCQPAACSGAWSDTPQPFYLSPNQACSSGANKPHRVAASPSW